MTLLGVALAAASAAAMGGATVLAKRRGLGRGPLAAGWVLAAVHPGLWQSPESADGEHTWFIASVLFTLTAAGVLAWSWWRPSPPPE